jgi:hypothetical protein
MVRLSFLRTLWTARNRGATELDSRVARSSSGHWKTNRWINRRNCTVDPEPLEVPPEDRDLLPTLRNPYCFSMIDLDRDTALAVRLVRSTRIHDEILPARAPQLRLELRKTPFILCRIQHDPPRIERRQNRKRPVEPLRGQSLLRRRRDSLPQVNRHLRLTRENENRLGITRPCFVLLFRLFRH